MLTKNQRNSESIFEYGALWTVRGSSPIAVNTFSVFSKTGVAVFNHRNGLRSFSRGKNSLHSQNLSTTVDKFSCGDITRSYRHHPQHYKQMRSAHRKISFVVTIFCLDKTKSTTYRCASLHLRHDNFIAQELPACSR